MMSTSNLTDMAYVLAVNDKIDRLYSLQEKQAELLAGIVDDFDKLIKLYLDSK